MNSNERNKEKTKAINKKINKKTTATKHKKRTNYAVDKHKCLIYR